MPFSWSDVSLHAGGASELRVRAVADGEEASLILADENGAVAATVGSLRVLPVSHSQVQGAAAQDGLLELDWRETALSADGSASASPPALAVVGEIAGTVDDDVFHVRYESVEALRLAVESGAQRPDAVLWEAALPSEGEVPEAARATTQNALAMVQEWLACESLAGTRLAVLTRGAVAVKPGDSPDLASAPVWGLLRSAQAEHPDSFCLVDVDGSDASLKALPAVLARDDEPQLALRDGLALAPRVVPPSGESLIPPTETWRLESPERGTLEGLALTPYPEARRTLEPDEVRIAMHVAGLSFRDVVAALGFDAAIAGLLGAEGAGVVEEVGSDVKDLVPGERVMGMIPAACAPLAISKRDLIAPVPAGWSFDEAAAMPSAFLTAYYGLCDSGLAAPGRAGSHTRSGGRGGDGRCSAGPAPGRRGVRHGQPAQVGGASRDGHRRRSPGLLA